MQKMTLCELEEWQRSGRAFTLLDVRRAKVREADDADIAGSVWRSPDGLFTWKDEVPRDRPVIFVCAFGHELSQGAAATLGAMGLDARYLVDGFAGWRDSGRPTVPLIESKGGKA
jgi:thiosulfate sulfurtransferase